ncbi:YggT family protein [Nocardioides massiliensis]|uniref:YggT family protein n=1 Tax=Nocardioides massiliensis TaxID=1325935 RepID=A0ABT9NT59_9ACTN|nr:YggT family protein [Nocardioides massiliensis]MDP9823501.1 YggT family protein [Nocardioides massiliensis]
MHPVGQFIQGILWMFMVLLIIRLVVDWIQVFARSWQPTGPILVVLEVVFSITDPPIKAIRKVIPPLRLGSIALDVSFILVFIVVILLMRVNQAIFLGLG